MSRHRTTSRTAVVVFVVVAVLAGGTGLAVAMAMAVHDGAAPARVGAAPGTSAAATAAPTGSAAPDPVTPTASSSPTSSARASNPRPATNWHPTTTAKPAPTTPGPPTGPSGPTPAAPGTYRYRQAGSLPGTPAEGALVVSTVSASGTQTWSRLVGGTIPPSTSLMLFNSAGSFLVSPGGQVAGASATCTFATPVPWPPWPADLGRTAAAQASCTGPVHSYQVIEQVQGTAAMSLDGHSVTTTIVVTTIVLKGTASGSPLTVTLTETDYYAPTLRVPVLTHTHIAGTAIGIPISTDRTDTLESARPA